ncbi:uncharacterized protein Z518_03441 [Rhinocladiella mackenziei CBS 650.93]|uniref:Rhinocladiella mackenziei CBS 650.93 unplaced genomic scaffold supercont1.2, whole genome shotgun sequence n=1 Tax=Rhinocladiella mackenziei CBS 650.93 TaxID=1442369 RepID=A0A0D2IS08_9EURO|nr:uncharacterized protein Z518_03441 [Rhinocladiella mackenziei CBS 650.93]KIX08784.1 hypothetical protein Z518_03441 [Rhinocladiella mackenziei CBS 650.93]
MSTRKLSTSEVRTHNTDTDCWIILNGVVWDISGFAIKHPGGREAIEEHFGQDGSHVYNDIHSPGLVENYFGSARRIGFLEDAKSQTSDRSPNNDNREEKTDSKPDLDSIISIYEFEEVAQTALKPKSWAYISGSTENGFTKNANADWYQRIWFRPRVLTGVGTVDVSTTILGQKCASPILNAPTSSVKLAHPDGELAWARALSACGNPMIIPTMSSYSVQEIVGALPNGHPFFFQLYVHSDRSELEKLLTEVCKVRPQAILVTVDLPVMTKREGYVKYLVRHGERKATKPAPTTAPVKPVYEAIDPDLTWRDIKYIQERTGLPVFVKGIQCAADARRSYELGCAGIYISNHGGRALDTAPPSILTLLEIQASCPEILDHMEIFIDGGIQRGTDILKAICLGASAVCLGRTFLYSLAYGEDGVKHAIRILETELKVAMQLVGITSLEQAHPGLLNTTELDTYIHRGDDHPWARKVRRSKL